MCGVCVIFLKIDNNDVDFMSKMLLNTKINDWIFLQELCLCVCFFTGILNEANALRRLLMYIVCECCCFLIFYEE